MKISNYIIISVFIIHSCSGQNANEKQLEKKQIIQQPQDTMEDKVIKTEEEWRKELTPGQFHILREKGTEYPFTGKFYKHNEKGMYVCAACGAELFSSDTKFDAGCGWPSFYESLKDKVITSTDSTLGMTRVEIMCKRCGGHLGHVFNDGPKPTGLRYCVNSESLDFKKPEEKNR